MNKSELQSLLISSDTTMKQAMQALNDTQKKILFVVDANHRLLGTVTDGDIRRAIINGLGFNTSADKIMHQTFVSVPIAPDMKEEARQLMIRTKVQQIPVLDPAGIINDVILWTDIAEEHERSQPKQLHSNHVVIMAGGKGTRLDPFTKILPKPLIPIGNKPIIQIIMEKCFEYGFHKFIYTLNYKKEYLKLFLTENKFPYLIDWVEEEEYLGTAGSLSLLKDRIDDTFFVINCDSLIDVDFEEILAWHKKHKAALTVVGCHNEFRIPFGVLEISNGRVTNILEKPVQDVIINTGVYVMDPHVISHIPAGLQVNMNELINAIAKHEKVAVFPINRGWFDIGQWEEYNNALKNIDKLKEI